MSRRHYNTYNNIILDNLIVDLLVDIREGEQGVNRHLARLNRRNMPNYTANYMRLMVDWGDGVVETVDISPLVNDTNVHTASQSLYHVYTNVGKYNVSIRQLTSYVLTRPRWFTFTPPNQTTPEIRVEEIKRFIFNGTDCYQLTGGSITPPALTTLNNVWLQDVTNIQQAFSALTNLQVFDIELLKRIKGLVNMNRAFASIKYPIDFNEFIDGADFSQLENAKQAFYMSINMFGQGMLFVNAPKSPSWNENLEWIYHPAQSCFEYCTNLTDYAQLPYQYKG